MSEPTHAVFLSYASQDAEPARRIAEALRAAGIEVWFDQSELRGGDAWDRTIRRQIKACALFVPIISRHTHARREGYFRLEWKLAADRSNLMSATRAFLVPVVVDDTREDDEEVPERFREVQWTRLPGGEPPPAFVERVQRLLAAEGVASTSDWARARTPPGPAAIGAPAMSQGSAAVPPSPTGPAPHARGAARRWAVVATLCVVALLLLGYFGLQHSRAPQSTHSQSQDATSAAASIAVLPFANESGDPGQQYFSDGIAEDLITALSQFQGLKVIGRSSAFQFRDLKEDSRTIGSKLGVRHLLEGSVRRSGDTIRVSAELIDTRDSTTRWSDRYDRPYKDLFALQDDITQAVTGALKTKLLPETHAAAQTDRPPSGSLEAHNAYLEGRFYVTRHSEADLRKAVELFTRATELDPGYALAFSELSRVWWRLSSEYLAVQAAQAGFDKARAAVRRALELAPELSRAHQAQSELLAIPDFHWRAAEAEARRALDLAPDDPRAKANMANQLETLGDLEGAIRLMRETIEIEPLQASGYSSLTTLLIDANRLDEAERAIRRAIELQPGAESYWNQVTYIEVRRGRAEAAIAAADREPPGVWHDIALAMAAQIGNDGRAADAALQNLIDKHRDLAAYQIAEVYALRRDSSKMFEWLDRAWSNRDGGISFLLTDPFILRYRDDPRLAAFCRKAGLPTPQEVAAHKPL